MSYPIENQLLSKLKQSIVQKQLGKRFHELLNTNIRINKDQKLNQIQLLNNNAILPSIVHGKIGLVSRNKSQSAKRIIVKNNEEKKDNKASMKSIRGSLEKESTKKPDNQRIQLLLGKKQNLIDNALKQVSTVRSKVYSMKTPQEDRYAKQITAKTKDVSIFRSGSQAKLQKQRQSSIKQFTAQIQQLNQDHLLQVRNAQISPQLQINKRFFAILANFKQKISQNYIKISKVLQEINRFITRYNIETGFIQVKRIIILANNRKHSNFQIVNLFTNKSQILSKKKIVGMNFHTIPDKKGKNEAASKIISFFKMIYSKRFYNKFKTLVSKVKIIQRYWRTCLLIRRTRKAMIQSIQKKIKTSHSLQKQLSKNWPIIKSSIRYQIHISSYCLQEFKRLTMRSIQQRQNNQISRIFKALQTDVHIIYITPYQIHEDLIKYYSSIFQFQPHTKIQEKIYFIIPENQERLRQYNLTTVTKLLYSPKALKRIKQIVGKQYAYLVPSFPSVEYINLSAQLNVPILSFNQNLAKLHSTKSGCMKIFRPLSLKDKPPFVISKSLQSIFSQKQLINSLAILINKYKHIKSWYLKIEDEIQGRGIAYLNINKIAFLRQLCSKQSQISSMYQDGQLIKLIVEELKQKLKLRLKILNKDIYANYEQFISHFLTRGGIIQAGIEGQKLNQFSISFFIDPTGQFNVIGTYNKLQLNGKSINQSIKVPSMLNHIDYSQITRNLYKQLWQKHKFYGYFTADFIQTQQSNLPYAIGLDCFLNQKTSSLSMINFCTGSKYNKDMNCLMNKQEGQHYIYCPIMKLYKPPQISSFFKNCKYQNVSFDLQKKVGTIFILIDKIENQQIGFLCVEKDVVVLLRQVKKIVDYFSRSYRQGNNSHDQVGLLKGVIATWLKKYDKTKQKVEDCL